MFSQLKYIKTISFHNYLGEDFIEKDSAGIEPSRFVEPVSICA